MKTDFLLKPPLSNICGHSCLPMPGYQAIPNSCVCDISSAQWYNLTKITPYVLHMKFWIWLYFRGQRSLHDNACVHTSLALNEWILSRIRYNSKTQLQRMSEDEQNHFIITKVRYTLQKQSRTVIWGDKRIMSF